MTLDDTNMNEFHHNYDSILEQHEENLPDQISELNEKISNLMTTVLDKDARITTLENKVASMSAILDIVSQQPIVDEKSAGAGKKQKRSRGKAELKLEFYKEHKDDPEVLEEIKVFRTTFPDMKTPPWQFRKGITDAMFEKTLV